ncbi:uncharacterized protein LOC110096058 [Dendrobium catenatum]|uniref:Transcriptional regulator TAC1 n=1 Tax=Dendrobium catenatum TaxID=906689 RepID=A0A2I0WAX9_9ASPA|nr:uncharacterized protein LOC110096058 [Dendrobium catenatum]PKU72810.1 Transcriptional regulator TAC1 [Dendrobium catenatum]
MEPEVSSGDLRRRSGGHSRSYECNFCKRGFSNAQALGGHMNIHRKDRAKMKLEPSSHDPLGFWVSYEIPTAHLFSSNTTSFVARHPGILPKGHGYHVADKASLDPSSAFQEEVEMSPRAAVAAMAEVDVDLELRLGPEPPPKDT